MKQVIYTIQENAPLTASVFRMVLRGDNSAITVPGQFVDVKAEGFFLRRPISVCDIEGDRLTLIFKIVGQGTAWLARRRSGEKLNALTGLGNGYDISRAGTRPVLLGGGVGVPPLYWLARRLITQGTCVTACLGFNTADEIFYTDEFRSLGCDVRISTVDGSLGAAGFVTDTLPDSPTHYFACGPEPMLRAVHRTLPCSGQLSLEARMGCGFGTCMGCSVETVNGYRRICRDGPVFGKEELPWEG